MNTNRRNRWRFFLEHAGYSTPPGRAACALELARAEELLEEATADGIAEVIWETDDFPYDPGDLCTEEEAARKFERGEWTGPYVGVVKIAGEWRSSISGVVFDSHDLADPYARVLAAELASELEHELRQAIGDARDERDRFTDAPSPLTSR